MFIKLHELKVDEQAKSYEEDGEICVQTGAIEFMCEYYRRVNRLVDTDRLSRLVKAGKIMGDSYPTKITFISGSTMVVAETISYIVEQANKPMFNT